MRLLAQLRRLHPEFRRETFLKGAVTRTGVKDVTWLNVDGAEMTQNEWQDANQRTLGIWFGERPGAADRLLLLVNAADSELPFALPAALGRRPVDLPVRHRIGERGGEQPRQDTKLRAQSPQRRAAGVLIPWTRH